MSRPRSESASKGWAPPDTNRSLEPQIVKKRQRRLSGIVEIVLPLTAKRLTTGEVAAHFAEVDGAAPSKDAISRIWRKGRGRQFPTGPRERRCCSSREAGDRICRFERI
jgi:mutator family transposase